MVSWQRWGWEEQGQAVGQVRLWRSRLRRAALDALGARSRSPVRGPNPSAGFLIGPPVRDAVTRRALGLRPCRVRVPLIRSIVSFALVFSVLVSLWACRLMSLLEGTVEASRAKRIERQQARLRDRGGCVPSSPGLTPP